MDDNKQDNSTNSLTNKSLATSSNEINSSMPPIDINEQQVDLNHDCKENETQNQIEEANNDEFIRITAAHQVLVEAQTYDEQKNYPLALHLYRICVDFLLEELMFAEGTEQSRIYLREKCTAIMNRIDILKTKLDPIPSSTETQQSIKDLPIDQLETLNLS
ncbi:unnamed protein product [Rotaria sp. Silwood1]|nr:unnamed protein product [Rotaria sp. Silwood1]CAF3424612.1 unnamed protein product [Rotaria sp. Silwood1]CAF3441881.1 unnamed protein product [Rotaria sp. Silwood1]CAF4763852.1 unnamed protein product [Rotaria sp. Silwood1]CAF4795020.1 unnamed protein product [Rotaria sp. Silwood1]